MSSSDTYRKVLDALTDHWNAVESEDDGDGEHGVVIRAYCIAVVRTPSDELILSPCNLGMTTPEADGAMNWVQLAYGQVASDSDEDDDE